MFYQNKNKTRFAILTLGLITGFAIVATALSTSQDNAKQNHSTVSQQPLKNNVVAEEDKVALKQQIQKLEQRIQELESKQKKSSENQKGKFKWFGNKKQTWDPFEEMERMQKQMDRLFQDSFRWGGSASKGMFRNEMFFDDEFKIKEKKNNYIIEFDLKGSNQGKVDIHIDEHSITITGEQAHVKDKEKKNQHISSKSYSTFSKTIPLPPDADTTNMRSEKKKDKLIISLPKKKPGKEQYL